MTSDELWALLSMWQAFCDACDERSVDPWSIVHRGQFERYADAIRWRQRYGIVGWYDVWEQGKLAVLPVLIQRSAWPRCVPCRGHGVTDGGTCMMCDGDGAVDPFEDYDGPFHDETR